MHARAGGVSLKVFGGIMLGISFVLLNNVAGHLGLLRDWTPWMVAALPSAVFMLHVAGRVRAGWCATDEAMQPGLILFAHGARDAAWAQPFEAVAPPCASSRPHAGVAAGLPGVHDARPGASAGAELAARRLRPRRRCCRCSWAPAGTCAQDLPLLIERCAPRIRRCAWSVTAGGR